MKMKVRALAILCITAIMITSFVSFGAAADSSSSKPATLRFAWWGADARHKATLAAIEEYKKSNPNVTIEGEYGGYDGYQQKLMMQLAGGTAPDLIQIDPIWNSQLGAMKENFVDLSKNKAVDLSQFDPKVIKGFCTTNNIVIGVPMGINGFGLQINKTFMAKHKLPLGKVWTWQDIISVGKKIHDADSNSYLFAIHPSGLQVGFISDYLRGKTGKYWVTDDYKVNVTKDQLADMYTVMKQLFDSGATAPFGEVSLVDNKIYTYSKFINGQIGMVEDWSGMVSSYKPVLKPENFTVGPAIRVKGAVNSATTYKPSMLLAVNAKSSNVQAAVKFANWFVNDQSAALILKDSRSITASKSLRKVLMSGNLLDNDIVKMVNTTLKSPAAPVPLIGNNAEVADITKDVDAKVVFGKLTPKQGAEELYNRITDKLKAIKAAN